MAVSLDLPGLDEASRFFVAHQRARVLRHYGVALDRGDRTRQRWERRWADSLASVWPGAAYDSRAANDGIAAAGTVWGRVSKAAPDGPDEAPTPPPAATTPASGAAAAAAGGTAAPPDLIPNIEAAIERQLGSSTAFASRAAPVFSTLAADTSEDAGQNTLDALGLNSTFRWTTVRDMPDRQFAVRGSKVLLHAHGAHLRRLAEIIADATDPRHPKTQSEIRKQIRDEWPRATAYQVARIARTESANVWENTNYNVARANGVQEFDWIVAHGPSIGPPKSYPVCPLCIARATEGPYDASDPNWTIPPRHPNCRCTMVPKLEGDWLPPAETWSGGPNPPLPLVGRASEWEPS